MNNPEKRFAAALSAAVLLISAVSCSGSGDGEATAAQSAAEAAETSAVQTEPLTEPAESPETETETQAPETTSAAVTTAADTEPAVTQAPETRAPETTAAETKPQTEPAATAAPETKAPEKETETVAAATTDSSQTTPTSPDTYVGKHIEGSVFKGYSAKGYDIEEKDGITYVGGILIANKTYSLPSTYVPEGFAASTKVTTTLAAEAQAAFEEMKAAFAAENPTATGFKIQSGYRSYAKQSELYNRYIANEGGGEKGKLAADTYSARPGFSEHQTGLAADINSVKTSTLYQSIGDTPEGKWLAANSWKYGFILRYPKGKTDVTGYIYEPWHFRYIGVEAATAVYASGLTLEEFLGIDSVYAD